MSNTFIRLYSARYTDYSNLYNSILDAVKRNPCLSPWKIIPNIETRNNSENSTLLHLNPRGYPKFGWLQISPKKEWIDITFRNLNRTHKMPESYIFFMYSEFISFLHKTKVKKPLYFSSLNFEPPFLNYPSGDKTHISMELHPWITSRDIIEEIMQKICSTTASSNHNFTGSSLNFYLSGSILINGNPDLSSLARVEVKCYTERIIFIVSPLFIKGKKTPPYMISFITILFSKFLYNKFYKYLYGIQTFNL